MRVTKLALSQAVLPSLAKVGIHEVDQARKTARVGRAQEGMRPRTLRERRRLYLLTRLIVKRHYHESLTLEIIPRRSRSPLGSYSAPTRN
jgi:hypothetical protein